MPSVPGDRMPVSISPGDTAFTRTPAGPRSAASSRVSAHSAAFEAASAADANGCTREPTMEVMFTTVPRAASSGARRPCTSATQAKKFTLKMCSQSACAISSARIFPPSDRFGDIAALLISASSPSPTMAQSRGISACTRSMSAKSSWTWFFAPPSHGQRGSKGWRERVSTRQPASLNVFTVAWPMPRLAPVSNRTRCLLDMIPSAPVQLHRQPHEAIANMQISLYRRRPIRSEERALWRPRTTRSRTSPWPIGAARKSPWPRTKCPA